MVAFGAFIAHIHSMTATRTSDRRKGRKTIASRGGDRSVVTQLVAMLNMARGSKPRHSVQITDGSGRHVELPDPMTDVMARAATLLAAGRSVSVVADDEILTTQGAAELLNVSRQYIVRLVDQGTLPAVRVGSHRRLKAGDVEAYKVQRDADRDAALDRLAHASEEIGGYGLRR